MAVLNIVLRDFALVDFPLFSEEVNGKALLESRITLVLFVVEDTVHGSVLPACFTARRRYALCNQLLGYGSGS